MVGLAVMLMTFSGTKNNLGGLFCCLACSMDSIVKETMCCSIGTTVMCG